MGEVAIEGPGFQHFDAENLQHASYKESQMDNEFAVLQQMNGEQMPIETSKGDASATKLLESGHMQYGCPHYRRRCRIRAPCCNEIFDCRHCHNDAKNNINVNQKQRHELPRHQVQQVVCSLCGTEQEVRQVCINCGVCMGKYFCGTCKLFDDDTSKKQYHCNGCGICRIGGRENFFHCYKCGCCYSILLKNSHPCVEGAMHHDCPVCFEVKLCDLMVIMCALQWMYILTVVEMVMCSFYSIREMT
ncbi:hypothetical protein ACJRO7_014436 [Eucalyptus globulus]|uniref:Uncharacterized protein n=1 Tax=Eucalyptus globulus TaxID=34317 RepID=A0ABD3L128_EUCGL